MRKIYVLLMGALLLVGAGCGAAPTKAEPNKAAKKAITVTKSVTPETAMTTKNGKKILIAYFSWSGNTRKLAQEIQKKTGGNLVEIETVQTYPKDYNDTVEQGKKELQEKVRPTLKTKIENFKDYDVIFLGSPDWWGNPPMAILTFVDSYDFTGKTVVPFFTHGGGGLQSCLSTLQNELPKAKITKPLVVRGGSVDSSNGEIDTWLKSLNL